MTAAEAPKPPEQHPLGEAAREQVIVGPEPVAAPADAAAPPVKIAPEEPETKPEAKQPAALPQIPTEAPAPTLAPTAEPTPAVEHAAPAAGAGPAPGMVSKKVVVRKTKSKILMRTSTEKVVTPEISDRILRGLREERPTAARAVTPAKPFRRKRPDVAEAPAAKVVEFPRPPVSPEEFKSISITEGVTLKELAEKMDIKSKYIIQKLISMGASAMNQFQDRDFDARMERTRFRPIPAGVLRPAAAFTIAALLVIAGFWFAWKASGLMRGSGGVRTFLPVFRSINLYALLIMLLLVADTML